MSPSLPSAPRGPTTLPPQAFPIEILELLLATIILKKEKTKIVNGNCEVRDNKSQVKMPGTE